MTSSQININPDVRQLVLTRDKVTLIDAIDHEWLSQWKWHICHDYAVRNQRAIDVGGHLNRKLIYLHKFIINPPENMEVDHINKDRMDNRRCNLRMATHSQNQMNTRKIAGCSSKYRGVSWHKASKKWRVQIQVNRQKIIIGDFLSDTHAALEYNKMAKKYFGDFVTINIIE